MEQLLANHSTEVYLFALNINGIKIFNFTSHASTIFSGQGSVSGDLETGDAMDSQWSYELTNCDGGSGQS